MSKSFSKKVHISNEVIFLLLIFLLGLLLRLVKFHFFSSLEADEGRDLLVARHMVRFGEFILLGHHCAGISGFYYGPFYYYFLALLTYLFNSPYLIFLFMTIWCSTGTISMFYIGKNLINKHVGLISALLYGVSFLMISTNNIWGPYVSFQIFILSLLFFSFYYRYKNRAFLYLHVFLFTLSFSMEYSYVIVLPVFIAWAYYLSKLKNKSSFVKTAFLYIFFLSITFIPQFIYFGSKIKYFFMAKNWLSSDSSFFLGIKTIKEQFFPALFNYAPQIVLYIICVLFPWFLLRVNKNKEAISTNKFFILVTPVFGLIASLISPNRSITYLLCLYLFFFLSLGLMIDYIAPKKNLLTLMLIVPIVIGLLPTNAFFYSSSQNNSLIGAEKVANTIKKVIGKNFQKDYLNNFSIVQNSNIAASVFFPGPEFYLFLEEKLNYKLINIVQESQFNYQNINHAKYVFLICRLYTDTPSWPNLCFDSFIKENGGSYGLKGKFYNSKTMVGYLFTRSN